MAVSIAIETHRFDGLAQTYDRYRPGYAGRSIEAVLRGLPDAPDIVDLGAGTGIGSRALLAANPRARVIAIEPHAEMRARAEATGVDARAGAADATGLPSASADAVVVFQAFHFFATRDAVSEIARLLRPGGRVALLWNERDLDDPFTAELLALDRAFADPAKARAIDFDDAVVEPLFSGAGLGAVRYAAYPNPQRIDLDGLLGARVATSFVREDAAARAELAERTRSLHERYADAEGCVTVALRSELFCAEKPPREREC